MFQGVIFDFDGVILDSEPLHYQAFASALEKTGLSLSYDEYIKKYLGLSDKDLFPRFFADRAYCFSLDEVDWLKRKKTSQYQDIIRHCADLPMIDSADEFIIHTAGRGSKTAICSGSTRNEIKTVLANLVQGRLQDCFNTIVSSDDVQQGKPSPEGYLLTARQLNLAPEECMVIEDTPHGIEAAKAAGMYVVALSASYTTESDLKHADRIIHHFSQLLSGS
ncbi:HAD family hydrolase [Legionella sp. CNM-4043-24]|uniref:HAD family hydrolase n=1 Tax=Legionella sp. CNM-4043-24 TaxID=3421646 RepID=UPI00403AF768